MILFYFFAAFIFFFYVFFYLSHFLFKAFKWRLDIVDTEFQCHMALCI